MTNIHILKQNEEEVKDVSIRQEQQKQLSAEIQLVLEDLGLKKRDLTEIEGAKKVIAKLYEGGFRPLIFIPKEKLNQLGNIMTEGFKPTDTKEQFTIGNFPSGFKKQSVEYPSYTITLGAVPMDIEGCVVQIEIDVKAILPRFTKEGFDPEESAKKAFGGGVALDTKKFPGGVIPPKNLQVLEYVGSEKTSKGVLMEMRSRVKGLLDKILGKKEGKQ